MSSSSSSSSSGGSSSTKKTDEGILVPGIESANALARLAGQTVAIFVRGLDVYSKALSGKVQLKGTDGAPIPATVIGAEPGRLYNLTTRFLGQAAAVVLGSQQAGGYNFQDTIHFSALAAAYGKESVEPLEPYTVILVSVDQAAFVG